MDFLEIARIGRVSAAIIDSAANRNLNICKKYYVQHRKERFADRTRGDDWERLAFALSWQSRFYRQGLAEGYGIRTLFDELFESAGEPAGVDWDFIVDLGVLRSVTFTTDPGQALREIPYDREPFEPVDEADALAQVERNLFEQIRQGYALSLWTDSQITNKADYPETAVAKWDQIIDQAQQFYTYSQGCEVKIGIEREALTFTSPGGVFAIRESDIPEGLVMETRHAD